MSAGDRRTNVSERMPGGSLRAQPLGSDLPQSYIDKGQLDNSVLRTDSSLMGYWWEHDMGRCYDFSHLQDFERALASPDAWYNSLMDEV